MSNFHRGVAKLFPDDQPAQRKYIRTVGQEAAKMRKRARRTQGGGDATA